MEVGLGMVDLLVKMAFLRIRKTYFSAIEAADLN
jgi:hypothetical protein